MFENDITKTYQLQDATLEIIIMLAGAFFLGCLFCWAMRKLRREPRVTHHQEVYPHRVTPQRGLETAVDKSPETTPSNKKATGTGLGAAGIIGGTVATAASLKDKAVDVADTAADKVSDAGSAVIDTVSDAGGAVGDKLSDAGSAIKDGVTDTITSAGDKIADVGSAVKETASDAVSATGAAITAGGASATDMVRETVAEATQQTDNFKKIEGIGPKIESVLHDAGIKTYADLRASDTHTLKSILEAAGPAFQMHDPESWPYQADLAYNNKWDKLKEYQDFLMGNG